MSQKSIELILFRQLAEYLALAVFIIDPAGNLIFCNEAAEKTLGFDFSDTGELQESEWSSLFVPQNSLGEPIAREELPFKITIAKRICAFDTFFIRTMQNKIRTVQAFSFPLINQLGDFYGAATFFQEVEE